MQVNHCSQGFELGQANISQELVDQSVADLIQSLAQPYLKLKETALQNHAINPQFHGAYLLQIPKGHLRIPAYLIEKNGLEGIRFGGIFNYKIIDLDRNNPIYSLLTSLFEQVEKLGFPCSNAEVRIEKGSFYSVGTSWHYDTPASRYFISVCYSNVPNWITRVLDPKDAEEILKEKKKPDEAQIEKIERLSQNAQFGLLYDVSKIFHRAPLHTDLTSSVLSEQNYRLFIRLTQ